MTSTRAVKAAPKASQTPEPDDEQDPGDGRPWAEFDFNGRSVKLYAPTDGQRFVLVQTIGITDESADDQERLELALGFAAMLRSLFVQTDERQFVTGALARGTADIEDYFGLARAMSEEWGIESEPPASSRTERRARERRPVAKTAPRARR